MRKNPERLAWLVLILSFTLCALTAAVVPASARRLIDEHTSTRPARLDIVHGTVLVKKAGTPGEQSAKDAMTVEPGDDVRTAGDARAILWLYDDSNIELGPDSSVSLRESYSTTFTDHVGVISLHLTAGSPVVNVALPTSVERRFTVTTGIGSLALDEGSYDLDLSRPNLGEAVVRVGKAVVSGAGSSVLCKTGERAEMRAGRPPNGPLSLAKNLVQNGNFTDAPLGVNWKGDERGSEGVKGTVSVATDRDGNLLRFSRRGQGHGENYAVQVIERDVSQFPSLRLSADIRLQLQTLGGGGVLGSEYPLHVRLLYRDARGREARYETGFYYQNQQGYPTPFGRQITQNEWYPFAVDLTKLDPRPAYLIYLEVAASGWDYESDVRNIAITAE
ncbi:MAG: FecR family protein [Chloroflexota bacterium]